jgi:precorrin isomerase
MRFMMRKIPQIEQQSYEIIKNLLPLNHLKPELQEVIYRVVHATADLSWADDIYENTGAIDNILKALNYELPVICDVEMTKSGIHYENKYCLINEVADSSFTRSYDAMCLAIQRFKDNAIYVVGCSPTALKAVLDIHEQTGFFPQGIIGVPVGFVGAKEYKERLFDTRLNFITNKTEKGGAAVGAAIINSLIYYNINEK